MSRWKVNGIRILTYVAHVVIGIAVSGEVLLSHYSAMEKGVYLQGKSRLWT